MEDEYLTKEDEIFLDNPSIKITFGINNKKEYFESDRIFDYLNKIRKQQIEDNDLK